MAIEPIKGFYVHDEATDTDGVAKIDGSAVDGFSDLMSEIADAEDAIGATDYVFKYGFESGTLDTSGNVVADSASKTVSDYIPVVSGSVYVTISNDAPITIKRATYDSSKTFIAYAIFDQNTITRDYTIPSNVAYVKFSVSKSKDFSFKLKENRLDIVDDELEELNTATNRLLGKNLCGNDPSVYYPVKFSEGDILTMSMSEGSWTSSDYNEFQFYNDTFTSIGSYSLNATSRTVTLDATKASTKYVKWKSAPRVPLQVEFGNRTSYSEYIGNVFSLDGLVTDVTKIQSDIYGSGNLCGNDPNVYYPVKFSEGDVITMSMSSGTWTADDYVDLGFYDGGFIRLGGYGLNATSRTVTISSTLAQAEFIKWDGTPTVPLQVEFGPTKTSYKEYDGNIFELKSTVEDVDRLKHNSYIAGPVPMVSVMTYNVGEWYNGTRTTMPAGEYELYESLQQEIMLKNYASIFCAQEYYYQMHEGAPNSRLLFLEPNFKHVSTAHDTQLTPGKAIGTNLRMISTEMVEFENKSGVAQDYQKSYIYINGHKVCVCNVHLSQIDQQQVLLEARELVDAVRNEEYFIVLGDFNTSFDANDNAVGTDIIDLFEDIGGVPCNCGSFGKFDTYRGSEDVSTSDSPIDNIFVSSNITIKSVYMDTTKIDAELPIQDHVPLVAYLEIL